MKPLILITALVVAPLPAFAETVRSDIKDHYNTVYENVPHTKKVCNMVDVPVYKEVQRQGNAAEGALLGMIIGGIAGKGITGDDGGAAAGAVMGGIIGADKGGKPKTERVITGYRQERQCEDVTYYKEEARSVYSHSTISFKYKGFLYEVPFQK